MWVCTYLHARIFVLTSLLLFNYSFNFILITYSHTHNFFLFMSVLCVCFYNLDGMNGMTYWIMTQNKNSEIIRYFILHLGKAMSIQGIRPIIWTEYFIIDLQFSILWILIKQKQKSIKINHLMSHKLQEIFSFLLHFSLQFG